MTQRIIKPERDTQNRAISTVLDAMQGYHYLGNLEDQENSNIREDDLRRFLMQKQKCNEQQASEAIRMLQEKAACSNYAALYDKGLDCYKLLRNGVQVSQGYGKVNTTIDYIDWKNPLNNEVEGTLS